MLKIFACAQAAHEANRAYCFIIGDATQANWQYAPEWQRESAVKGVEAVLANPDITPEQLHESWGAAKIADGWRYGPVKNADAKTHPCLVPYDQLPEEQRVKDAIFGGTVRAMAKALGLL